jgi:hypothetical protein
MHRLCAVPKYISVLLRTDEAPSPLSCPPRTPGFAHRASSLTLPTKAYRPSLYPRLRPGAGAGRGSPPTPFSPRLTPSAHVWLGTAVSLLSISSLCPVPRSSYRRTGAAMAFLLDLRTDSDSGTP